MRIFKNKKSVKVDYNGVPVYVVYVVAGASMVISIISLAFSIRVIRGCGEVRFDYTKLVELSGLIFSVIGVVFALFFVIIGLDANKKKNEFDEIERDIKSKKLSMENLSKTGVNHQDEMYSRLLSVVQNTVTDQRIRKSLMDDLYLSQARLATQSKSLDKDKRIKGIQRILDFGCEADIYDLRMIESDPFEDIEIKDKASTIRKKLEDKLRG